MPAPLVVALHGCTQTAADFAAGTRFDSVAQQAGAYVLYPEQSPIANSRRCWNWFLPKHQGRSEGEPAKILELLDTIRANHTVDASRLFVAGLSAGGAMAAILAEQAPDVFAAAGIMSGVPLHAAHDLKSAHALMAGEDLVYVSPTPPPGGDYQRLRVMIWQGDEDRVVAPMNATLLARQFAELLGLRDVAPEAERRDGVEIQRWRSPGARACVEVWGVARMKHGWSGGSYRGSHTWPAGPRASEEMMSFFLSGENASKSVGT